MTRKLLTLLLTFLIVAFMCFVLSACSETPVDNTPDDTSSGETQGDSSQGGTQGGTSQGDNSQGGTQGGTSQGDNSQGGTQGGTSQGDGTQGSTQGGTSQGDGTQGSTQGGTSQGGTHEHANTDNCAAFCIECSVVFRTPMHKFDGDCDALCNTCGMGRETSVSHIYEISCDTICDVCGVLRESVSHTYENSCDTICDVCGVPREIEHTFDNKCDTMCNVCSLKRTIEHTYDSPDDTICNVCGHEIVNGHDCRYAAPCHKLCLICWKETGEGHVFVDKVCTKCGQYDRCEDKCDFDNSCDTTCSQCGYERYAPHNYENDICKLCGKAKPVVHICRFNFMCDDTCLECGEKRVPPHVFASDCDQYCNFCEYTRVAKIEHIDSDNNKMCDRCSKIVGIDSATANKIALVIYNFNNYLVGIETGKPIFLHENKKFTNIKVSGDFDGDYIYNTVEMYDNGIHYKYNDEFNLSQYTMFGDFSHTVEYIKDGEYDIIETYTYVNNYVDLPRLEMKNLVYDEANGVVSIKKEYLKNLFYTLIDSPWSTNVNIANIATIDVSNVGWLIAAADAVTCSIKPDTNGNITWYRFELKKDNETTLLNEYSVNGNNIEIKFNKENYNGTMNSTLTITSSKFKYTANILVGDVPNNLNITADVSSTSSSNMPELVDSMFDTFEYFLEYIEPMMPTFNKEYEVISDCYEIAVPLPLDSDYYLVFEKYDNGNKYYASEIRMKFQFYDKMCLGKIEDQKLIVLEHDMPILMDIYP